MTCKIHINKRIIPADLETPVSLYLKIRDLHPSSALLESSDYHTSSNAMSYIGVEPTGAFTVHGERIITTRPDGSGENTAVTDCDGVVPAFNAYLKSYSFNGEPESGNLLFGFTAYDAVRYFEKVDIRQREDRFRCIPDMKYIFYRYVICLNHYKTN